MAREGLIPSLMKPTSFRLGHVDGEICNPLLPLLPPHALLSEGMSGRPSFVGYFKVPKCEKFHPTDFFYFFTIKPLWVGDFRAKIKN